MLNLLFLNVFSFAIYNNSIVRFVTSLRVVYRIFSRRTVFHRVQRLSKFNRKFSTIFICGKEFAALSTCFLEQLNGYIRCS